MARSGPALLFFFIGLLAVDGSLVRTGGMKTTG
jgi:hypothetical protein